MNLSELIKKLQKIADAPDVDGDDEVCISLRDKKGNWEMGNLPSIHDVSTDGAGTIYLDADQLITWTNVETDKNGEKFVRNVGEDGRAVTEPPANEIDIFKENIVCENKQFNVKDIVYYICHNYQTNGPHIVKCSIKVKTERVHRDGEIKIEYVLESEESRICWYVEGESIYFCHRTIESAEKHLEELVSEDGE